MALAAMISLRPMLVIWSTFLPKSGERASSATSSSTKPSTFCSSAVFFSASTGTSPLARSGATVGTGSGGVRFSSVAVAVCVSFVVAMRFRFPPMPQTGHLSLY